MDEQSKNDDLISAISSEISECREDERSAQNMILQVIATGGTVLGILTGASFFFENTGNQNDVLSFCLFGLSGLILCACYLYLYTLGIGNVLRFHYLRGLEDRMAVLLCDNQGDDDFVSWMSFSSPITTRNPAHLKTVYTWIHFLSYLLATAFAGAFGIAILFVLYDRVDCYKTEARYVLDVYLFIMGFFGVVFLASCIKAKSMYDYALKTSLEKRKKRVRDLLSEELKNQATDRINPWKKMLTVCRTIPWKKILMVCGYYLYPRVVDFQKPLLIVVGFLFGWFLKKGTLCLPDKESLLNMLFVWFVVDFLVYQARYLWNDLRGMQSDKAARKKDRLPTHLLGDGPAVIIALAVMLLRLVLAAVLIGFAAGDMRSPLCWLSVMVFVIAVVYEKVSENNLSLGVYAVVSLGYPLRMLAGVVAAWPQFGSTDIRFGNINIEMYHLIPILLAVGMLGSFSSILAWTHKGIDQMKKVRRVHKDYYKPLIQKLGSRIQAEYPLKEKGMISDHWNVTYLIAMGSLALVPCMLTFGSQSIWIILALELIGFALAIKYGTASQKQAVLYLALLAAFMVGKIVWGWKNLDWYMFYGAICVLQTAVTGLYFYLRMMFDINYSFAMLCKGVLAGIVKLILGKETVGYFEQLRKIKQKTISE